MKTRNLTVYEGSGKNYAPIPKIILQGQWIGQLGFSIGDKVKVMYQDGQIIVEKALEAESGQADQRISMVAESDNPYGKE